MSTLDTIAAVVARADSVRGSRVTSRLRAQLEAALRAPQEQHERLAAALVLLHPPLQMLAPHCEMISPAYPLATREVQARLALGEAPTSVLPGLTRAEAHAALSAGVVVPTSWVLRGIPAHRVRSLEVARWVAACWSDPPRRAALQTEREERIAGQTVRGRLLDRIDEIETCDLSAGAASGVQPTFEAAATRVYASWERGAEHDSTPLASTPSWWRAIPCARLLLSSAALVEEGRDMQHCVGAYAAVVRRGEVVIVSIAVRALGQTYRSTVEVDRRTRVVYQHRGPSNRPPHPLCVAALAVCQRRWAA